MESHGSVWILCFLSSKLQHHVTPCRHSTSGEGPSRRGARLPSVWRPQVFLGHRQQTAETAPAPQTAPGPAADESARRHVASALLGCHSAGWKGSSDHLCQAASFLPQDADPTGHDLPQLCATNAPPDLTWLKFWIQSASFLSSNCVMYSGS